MLGRHADLYVLCLCQVEAAYIQGEREEKCKEMPQLGMGGGLASWFSPHIIPKSTYVNLWLIGLVMFAGRRPTWKPEYICSPLFVLMCTFMHFTQFVHFPCWRSCKIYLCSPCPPCYVSTFIGQHLKCMHCFGFISPEYFRGFAWFKFMGCIFLVMALEGYKMAIVIRAVESNYILF